MAPGCLLVRAWLKLRTPAPPKKEYDIVGSQQNTLIVRPAHWPEDSEALMAVRYAVFVDEQGVPVELERDGLDPSCSHAVAVQGDTPVGAGRITDAGHIGRVAVLASLRGQGIGTELIRCLIGIAASTASTVPIDLNAQLHAVDFYKSLGFESVGPVFLEAGIEHVRMVLRTSD